MRIGSNFAVFLLFFGLALMEALKSENLLLSLLFILIGAISLFADKNLTSKN